MVDAKKIDPFDVEALEKSLNDSATRVSTIWVSFLVFGLYLVVAAGNVTHRQLLLEDAIKLPVLNIDLPLVGFFFLAPTLFVILQAYVLIQVVLLARTAAAYNDAIEHTLSNKSYQARVRQRLANTLFAQIFAGSPRERRGLFGAILRLIAFITLVLAPALVLLLFEIKFLPYHDRIVTSAHRVALAVNLATVFLLWPMATNPLADYSWQAFQRHRDRFFGAGALALSVLLLLFSVFAVSFPGEGQADLTRESPNGGTLRIGLSAECGSKSFFAKLLPSNFDRLYLPNVDVVDDEVLIKLERAATEKGQRLYEGQRTRDFSGRNLSCSFLNGADLRRSDFTNADLHGASFGDAELRGTTFSNAELRDASMSFAKLQEVSFDSAGLKNVSFFGAEMYGASLVYAELQGADLSYAKLWGANLSAAKLHGAQLVRTELQGAYMHKAQFHGASLKNAKLNGAGLFKSEFQGADLSSTDMQGALLSEAQLQGANFEEAQLGLATIAKPFVWRTGTINCDDAQIVSPEFKAFIQIKFDEDGEEKNSQVIASPDSIESFVSDSFSDISDKRRQASLKAEIRRSLGSELSPGTTGEQIWRACAAREFNKEAYEKRLVEYLIKFACADRPNQEYVINGVHSAWTFFGSLSGTKAQQFARALLGLDGKVCPGAANLVKADLQRLMLSANAENE
jgi:uncharacterized protein YjbI with pentapeptide repeats